MIGAEKELPDERPPLSKEYLAGEKTFERLLIRPADFWASKSIEIRAGAKVCEVRPDAHQVVLEDESTLGYQHLIWATGGAPRSLVCSGHDLRGVHSVRSRADVDSMMKELPATRRVVVIGGGYIGLEAAAVISKLDKQIVVLEALDPAERLAFVLHDMFAMPFEEIAPMLGRSSAAARQLASRARRRVQGATPTGQPDRARQRADRIGAPRHALDSPTHRLQAEDLQPERHQYERRQRCRHDDDVADRNGDHICQYGVLLTLMKIVGSEWRDGDARDQCRSDDFAEEPDNAKRRVWS